ncbi:MAG: hypothetical protein HKN51_12775 [Saprospiraceae bacterium]|nr:hypothetical protein [Saprospiraceae bacterium]
MKNLLYTLSMFLLLTSCKNIEKMVEKGEYDKAIVYATKKLAGKKNKKTSHVKALEDAFLKVSERDYEEMNYLSDNLNSGLWDNAIRLTNKIEARQNKVKPFLPLVSEEGYVAHFKFIKTRDLKHRALDSGAEFRYNHAVSLLDRAIESNEKSMARRAYFAFKDVGDYRFNYKNSIELEAQAYKIGVTHILVKFEHDAYGYIPFEMTNLLDQVPVNHLDTKWKDFHTDMTLHDKVDYIATVEILDIDVSPERETVSHHVDKKKIKTGFKYAKKKNGEFKIDSTGSRIKIDIFKKVKARVTEIIREKSSFVAGRLTVSKVNSNRLVKSIPIEVENEFNDYALRFNGDKRALCEHDIHRIKANPLPFPHDIDMILDATSILELQLNDELRSLNI